MSEPTDVCEYCREKCGKPCSECAKHVCGVCASVAVPGLCPDCEPPVPTPAPAQSGAQRIAGFGAKQVSGGARVTAWAEVRWGRYPNLARRVRITVGELAVFDRELSADSLREALVVAIKLGGAEGELARQLRAVRI